MPAWRTPAGEILLTKEGIDCLALQLPCGRCLGCQKSIAKGWALRAHLELQKHDAAVFTTLTFDDEHLPPALDKQHVQKWLKRLRHHAARPIRYFACGEYGEQNGRPHYHAILYGLSESDQGLVDDTWAAGRTQTVNVTPEAIAYVAGYCNKKIGDRPEKKWVKVGVKADEDGVYLGDIYERQDVYHARDPQTGEWRTVTPPFRLMSRRPGIGGHAREWPQSWRLYAIHQGHRMPVPRFLHESWKATATPEQQEKLMEEKAQITNPQNNTEYHRKAAEKIDAARNALSAKRRKA